MIDPKPIPRWADFAKLANQIDASLGTACPEGALRALVYRWFEEGFDEGEALSVLIDYREKLREQGRDSDEDVVDEILSYLDGWCGPDARIRRRG